MKHKAFTIPQEESMKKWMNERQFPGLKMKWGGRGSYFTQENLHAVWVNPLWTWGCERLFVQWLWQCVLTSTIVIRTLEHLKGQPIADTPDQGGASYSLPVSWRPQSLDLAWHLVCFSARTAGRHSVSTTDRAHLSWCLWHVLVWGCRQLKNFPFWGTEHPRKCLKNMSWDVRVGSG